MKRESIPNKTLLLITIMLAVVSTLPIINRAAAGMSPQGKGGTIKAAPTPTPAPDPTAKPKKGASKSSKSTTSTKANRKTGPPDASRTTQTEIAFWNSIKDSTDPEDFRAYLQKYPKGEFANLARNRLRNLETSTKPPGEVAGGSSKSNSSATAAPLAILKGHGRSISEVRFSPDGKFIASSGEDGTVKMWDAQTGSLLSSIQINTGTIVFSPDGQMLAGIDDKTVRVWNVPVGKEIYKIEAGSDVIAIAFSPDGKELFIGTESSGHGTTAKIFNARTGALLGDRTAQLDIIQMATYSPDGKFMAAGHDFIKLYNMETGQVFTFPKPHSGLTAINFSPDGRRLVSTGHEGSIRIWDVATLRLTRTLEEHSFPAYELKFSPDGKRVAALVDNAILFWEAATGRRLKLFPDEQPGSLTTFDLSPDGLRLAAGSRDATIKLWRVED